MGGGEGKERLVSYGILGEDGDGEGEAGEVAGQTALLDLHLPVEQRVVALFPDLHLLKGGELLW